MAALSCSHCSSRSLLWLSVTFVFVLGLLCLTGGASAEKLTDKLTLTGYVQPRFVWTISDTDDPETAVGVRRARIGLEYEPLEYAFAKMEVGFGDREARLTHAYVDLYTPSSLVGEHQALNWRARLGQAKVPFGVDVPMSSSRRILLERIEVVRRINPGEWDQGLWISYSPHQLDDLFSKIKGNYGPSEYGLATIGIMNGQGHEEPELDDSKVFVFDFRYPFAFRLGGSDQVALAGISGRYGEFTNGGSDTITSAEVDDRATEVFFFMPPQPFGLQVEWVLDGEGAALNESGTQIVSDDVDGFGIQGSYKAQRHIFALRYDEMNGSRKRTDRPPTPNDFERWSLGWVYELSGRNRITVEYDNVDRNGRGEDTLGFQLQLNW